MLIDALDCPHEVRADSCIIGSGIGGGTLACCLGEQGKGFVIVEAGGLKGDSDSVRMECIGRDFGVRTTRSIQLGGTSNYWHGVLAPLDPIDFEKREWVPNSGWPIRLGDLQPYYAEAARLLGVENYAFFQVEGLSPEMKRQLERLPYDREYLVNKLFQQPVPPVNFKYRVLNLVKNSRDRHCYYNAVALELVPCAQGNAVERLIVGRRDGSTFSVRAKRFIVATGALETPRLLLNSRKNTHQGLGNDSGNVGRFLMDHPMGNLCQIRFREPMKAPIYSDTRTSPTVKIKSGLELSVRKQRELRMLNHNFFLRPSFVRGIDNLSEKVKLSLLSFKDGGVTVGDIWRVMTHPNVIRQILAYKLTLNVTFKYADLFFLTEQIPNPDSTVSLSGEKDCFGYPIARVNWQVMEDDIQGMRRWFDLLRERLFPTDHYEFTHTERDFNWPEIFTTAIHHVGTARMSESPHCGVVDRNLRLHGVKNVYICDGSVFTTAGNVNNSLTISALACRLADHLRETSA